MGVKDDVFGRGLNSNPNPNNLVKRLELLILETKAILLRSTLDDKKEQERLEMHYGFKQEHITIEIEGIFTN